MENVLTIKELEIAIENFLQDYEDEETLISLGVEETQVEGGLNEYVEYEALLKNIELNAITHSVKILTKENADLALENMLHSQIYQEYDKLCLTTILSDSSYDGFGTYLKERNINIPSGLENMTMLKIQSIFSKHFEAYINYNRDLFGYECFSNMGIVDWVKIGGEDNEDYFIFLNHL